MRVLALSALLLAMASPLARSADTSSLNAQDILIQQQAIRADAAASKGRYRDMPESERAKLYGYQDTVTRLLTGVTLTTELAEKDQLTVANALEAVEAIVNKAEDERRICERQKPTGSNRSVTVCRTVAQRRAERERLESDLKRDGQCVDGWNSGSCNN